MNQYLMRLAIIKVRAVVINASSFITELCLQKFGYIEEFVYVNDKRQTKILAQAIALACLVL
jgi:hypothetical protein